MTTDRDMASLKVCKKCDLEKPRSEYQAEKRNDDGLYGTCKECVKARYAEWRSKNPDKVKEYRVQSSLNNPDMMKNSRAKWVKNNPEKVRGYNLKWREGNRGVLREYATNWAKSNPEKVNARIARRKAAKHSASPAWSIQFIVDEAYALAHIRSKVTGIKYNVDHIVPLQSNLVCGLHSHTNLQVIPAISNMVKGNNFWPDMP